MSSTAPFFLQQLTDNSGKPLSGGKLFSYVGGSTNLPKTLYYDKDFTTPCPNPLIADASGTLPQYFLTSGFYKFEVKTSADVLISTRDYVQAGGVGSSSSDYKVKTSNSDTTPDFLISKLVPGAGMDVTEVVGATRQIEIASKGLAKVSMGDSAGYLDSKFTSSPSVVFGSNGNVISATVNPSSILDGKVKVDSGDLVPGYLVDKMTSSDTIGLSTEAGRVKLDVLTNAVTGDHKVKVDGSDTQAGTLIDKIEDTATVHWDVEPNSDGQGYRTLKATVQPAGILDYKVKYAAQDPIPSYLFNKIKGGAGIVLTNVSDGVNGNQIVINSRTNSWRPIKYVSGSYVLQDNDDTIVVGPSGGDIIIPDPSVTYEGRLVTFQSAGCNIISSVTCNNEAIFGDTPTFVGYSSIELLCVSNGTTYIWVCKSWGQI